VSRAVLLQDAEATTELEKYFLRIIHPKFRRVEESHGTAEAEKLLTVLLDKAHHAAKKTLSKPVEVPRNYVVRAITNQFLSSVKRLNEKPGHVQPSPFGLDGVAHSTTISNESELDELKVLERLRSRADGTTALKVVQVIELVYHLGVSETEACRLMNFGPDEAPTILRTLRRWRSNPESKLHTWFRESR
jgi:hypothetical protein